MGAGSPLTIPQLTGWSSNKSSSSSGLPGWAQSYLQKWIGNMAPNAWTNYQRSLQALNNSNTFIDNQRKLMNDQYQRDIFQPTQNTIGNAMNQFMGKGTFGSSMMGDWSRNFGGQMNAGMAQQANQANQWAAQSKLGMIGQRVNANMQFADLMKQLLGLSNMSGSGSYSYSQNGLPAGTTTNPNP